LNVLINLICSIKSERDAHTVIVADHFYSIDYLEELEKKDYASVRNNLILYIIISAFTFIGFLSLLVITFNFLKIKSLSMIPLFCLIALTICFSIFIIQIIRLGVINKLISGHYEISSSLLKLIIYKIKNTKEESTTKSKDLLSEIANYCFCCRKKERSENKTNKIV